MTAAPRSWPALPFSQPFRTEGLVAQRSDKDRFGGPYLILSRFKHNLEKGDFPVLAYVRQLFGASRPLRGIWRTLWRTLWRTKSDI